MLDFAVTLSLMSSLSFGYSSNLSARPVDRENIPIIKYNKIECTSLKELSINLITCGFLEKNTVNKKTFT